MKIKTVELEGFMSHARSVIELPETGVVYVTGPNGAGKSSIIEAPSVAGWNTTLRKKPPWSSTKGLVRLHTYGSLVIERIKTKSAVKVRFDDQQYENNTKAQEALERVIGDHDIWRRTNVLSSQDAASFTIATDSDRKRMLETVLGLARFDAASAACGKDLREQERRFDDLQGRVVLLNERLEARKQRLADKEQLLESAKPAKSADVSAELKVADERRKRLKSEIDQLNEAMRELQAEQSANKAEVNVARRGVAALAQGNCGECGKPYTESELRAAKAKMKLAEDHFAQQEPEIKKKLDRMEKKISELDEQYDALLVSLSELKHRAQESDRLEREHKSLKADVRELTQQVEDAHDEYDAAVEQRDAQGHSIEVLRVANKVLSLNGVRAHLLHSALSGIEQIANVWLNRIASLDGKELQLRLTPYSEKASGGVKDAISLDIDGAGNGHGYKAASGGERRRIDIALMFALAEIAEAAYGLDAGTMFMDEVLDSVDAEGIEAACDVIAEIAQTRCVVVISHNPLVGAALKNCTTRHYQIENGRVR